MQYYHEIITQKSFVFLQTLKREYKFILIGGWAVFLHSKSLKSKDIDIIADYSILAEMKEKYDVSKNERLKRYEIKTGEFDIDIYLGHYSDLGIGIEKIKQSAILKDGFSIPRPEMLLLLKLFAWENRRGSAKGQKDELDIFSLAFLPEFDWNYYRRAVEDCGFEKYNQKFVDLLKARRSIGELSINEQKMARLRKKILAAIG
jgi:hypothetical protein